MNIKTDHCHSSTVHGNKIRNPMETDEEMTTTTTPTTTTNTTTTTISAPGKALLAGGYLVLESPNPGLVIATNSCFHVTIAHRPHYVPPTPTIPNTTTTTSTTPALSLCDGTATQTNGLPSPTSIPIPVDVGLAVNNTTTSTKHSSSFRYCPLDVYSPQFHEVYTYWLRIYCATTAGDDDGDGRDQGDGRCTADDVDAGGATSDGGANDDPDRRPLVQLVPRYRTQATNSYVEKTIVLAMSFTLLHPSMNSTTSSSASKSTSPSAQQPQQSQLIMDQLFRTYPPKDSDNHQQQPQQSLAIKLRADNDFYSPIPHLDDRNLSYLPKNVSSLPPFIPCPITTTTTNEQEDNGGAEPAAKVVTIHKTGLGSSAALVTSLVAAILSHFQITTLPSSPNNDHPPTTTNTFTSTTTESSSSQQSKSKQMIHNLAQISHSIAQGKIGSGFDVSAAVHGTHVYKRFDPNHIRVLMDDLTSQFLTAPTTMSGGDGGVGMEVRRDVARRLYDCVTGDGWDATADPLCLPKGVELMMADVCGGSESPSMAKKVLAWKKARTTALKKSNHNEMTDSTMKNATTNEEEVDDDDEWKKLEQLNENLRGLFEDAASTMKDVDIANVKSLQRFRLDDVSTVVESNDKNHIEQYNIVLPTLKAIRQTIRKARTHLKRMGLAANVPIEPDEQSRLADATMDLPGVIAAGVPGAGGYDALFVLYIEGVDTNNDDDDDDAGDKRQKIGEGSRSSSRSSRNTTSTVRDQIGQLWLEWCEKERKEGRRGLVCPLACKSAGFGGMHGLHQSNLQW